MNQGKELYHEIDVSLRRDQRPSECLRAASRAPEFRKYPFSMLYRLIGTKQSPKYHMEGDAWNHTLLVLDEAALKKGRSADPDVFMWAALLHDIGKPDTTRMRNGRITSYNHEYVGAGKARAFLAEFAAKQDFIEKTAALIRWHMQLLHVVRDLPFARIPEMTAQTDINEVALLGLCDRLGRAGADRALEERNVAIFLEKCRNGGHKNGQGGYETPRPRRTPRDGEQQKVEYPRE